MPLMLSSEIDIPIVGTDLFVFSLRHLIFIMEYSLGFDLSVIRYQ